MNKNKINNCFHCGLPIPESASYSVVINNQSEPMCCRGCQAVAQAIVDNGLSAFYEQRTAISPKASEQIPDVLKQMELYDRADLQESFVEINEDAVREASLMLEGIVCSACVWLNEKHVNALPGVIEFYINYSTQRARLKWDDSQIHLSSILKAISEIGYIAHPYNPDHQEQIHRQERQRSLRRLFVAGIGMMQVMTYAVALYAGAYQNMEHTTKILFWWVSLLIATPVVLYAAQPFFISAWRDLKSRHLGMDVPVSLAIGGAFLASVWATLTQQGEVYFDSVSMFTFFLLTGRFLEMSARQRAGQAAEELMRLLPAFALRKVGNSEEMVPVSDLVVGDCVLIKPGDIVPVDGVVIDGSSSVDESLLTGESKPLRRVTGDMLVGGSLNVESPLLMNVEKVGEETVHASIVRLLDRAQTEKPEIARIADRVAGWFVAVLLVIATVVAWWWWKHAPEDAFWIVLATLVVTCPCALSLATPAAIAAATSTLTQLGVLTTRGHALETLSHVDQIIFDKTGTLTEGELHLEQVKVLHDTDEKNCLTIAGALEAWSEHPIAKVLSKNNSFQAASVTATAGKGVEGLVGNKLYRIGNYEFVAGFCAGRSEPEQDNTSNTLVYLGDEQNMLAVFVLSDSIRQGAQLALQAIRKLGIDVHLLSGDEIKTVTAVAQKLDIIHYKAGFLPEDKLSYMQGLQAKGHVVAMVGDGVNDAPVLAGAQVSLAMGGGTRLAHASADMILLSEKLQNLPESIHMAKRTLGIIRQNLTWAVLYNAIAIPLAVSGFIAPWMAALGMSASSLLVVLNALRLKKL
ncbi:MAG: heavy metal translocating P-type ATPase [Gammaproteobacteria bacterium]|nr:heavy metal translocating P-type ATPase [Gammaproteobacteria bacterium]